ncbi:hypothetical protein [Sessilibacter corallicola]|uniref:Sulfotransferase family protein n=1 Tax=Sessilibacter corallicola TaxID=2904075 RepID=A0ABQ0A825_9GAMM
MKSNDIEFSVGMIHHFACTGGTLISKCIAALPNTYVLSELHPHTCLHINEDKPKFSPTDITTLARYSEIPFVEDLSKQLFLENIKITARHVALYGGNLVVRDHSHSDYCVGVASDTTSISTVYRYLKSCFNINRLVSVRNPIDSFLSLKKNGWVHFEPRAFEEYCRRYLIFIDQFDDSEIIYYEDFVDNPKQVMNVISIKLSIEFDERFINCYNTVKMSGDSGRKTKNIEARVRREMEPEFLKEIEESKSFELLKKKLVKYSHGL